MICWLLGGWFRVVQERMGNQLWLWEGERLLEEVGLLEFRREMRGLSWLCRGGETAAGKSVLGLYRGGSYWGLDCSAVCVKGEWQHHMSILVGDYHLLNNLLDVFVSSFYNNIHLWPI
jgi:hypothetical protein